ncbi:unnamed protein product [Symbiodinium sp. KB8]|nr:unnamed protein product [Symbiodinium sp. KB8]
MATCRAERRLQYDLECQCFYLLRAEERASTAVAVLRALLQLPLLRGGQRGLIAGLVASFLTPVLVEPTALPVVEPIRFPTFQDARGLLPPFVVLPSVLVDLWAEVHIVRCLNSGLRAWAMEHWWNRGKESRRDPEDVETSRKTPKSRLGPETTLKQAETPKSVFRRFFTRNRPQKLNGPSYPPIYIY